MNAVLSDLVLQSRVGSNWTESGMDCFELCTDKNHFKNYPYYIEYDYNSRGFRDAEWPKLIDELQSAIWCMGDSFTVGLGSPLEHTWPYILQRSTNTRTLNISMDGASNNWIARKLINIQTQINPQNIVVCWSYTHRREIPWVNVQLQIEQNYFKKFKEFYHIVKSPEWPNISSIESYNNLSVDIRKEVCNHCVETFYFKNYKLSTKYLSDDELRKLHYADTSDEEDFANFLNCLHSVEQNKDTNIVHCTIPNFCPKDWEEQYVDELSKYQYVGTTKKLDLARDGHHFDKLTSANIVDRIIKFL